MPSPAVNRNGEGTHSPGKTKTIWPARDSRSMSPTRSKPINGQSKINIVIDSFMLPDNGNNDVDDKFVRDRLYSDEQMQHSEGSGGERSPNNKAKTHEEKSVSSNPDLEDEFAFNKNWGKP